jgi:hypothetical protein
MNEPIFKVGDKVSKTGGDYTFHGTVVCVFRKLSGAIRIVAEDKRGLLLIHSEKTLTPFNSASGVEEKSPG